MTQTPPNNTNTPQPPLSKPASSVATPTGNCSTKPRTFCTTLMATFGSTNAPECGLVSTQPKLSNQAMQKYYPEDYIAYPIAVDDEKPGTNALTANAVCAADAISPSAKVARRQAKCLMWVAPLAFS